MLCTIVIRSEKFMSMLVFCTSLTDWYLVSGSPLSHRVYSPKHNLLNEIVPSVKWSISGTGWPNQSTSNDSDKV
jgi:hypothetical protein